MFNIMEIDRCTQMKIFLFDVYIHASSLTDGWLLLLFFFICFIPFLIKLTIMLLCLSFSVVVGLILNYSVFFLLMFFIFGEGEEFFSCFEI